MCLMFVSNLLKILIYMKWTLLNSLSMNRTTITDVLVPSVDEPPKLDLKQLPCDMKYSFFGENETFLVIIFSKLEDTKKGKIERHMVFLQRLKLRVVTVCLTVHESFLKLVVLTVDLAVGLLLFGIAVRKYSGVQRKPKKTVNREI
ncbi:integrase [Gossypium australe]|uniref:Integrase n=1 Tax=Gossypium australe TaxID=47621 RepID=A0A5B6WSD9_9ROSI|nr:integrase [Gossypium australe]